MLWFESPCAASWSVAALVPAEDRASRQLLDPKVMAIQDRERMDRAKAELQARVGGQTWSDTAAAVGISRVSSLQARMDPRLTFASAFLEARYAMVDDVASLFAVPGEDDDLARAEAHFWGSNRGVLNSALHCSTTSFLIRRSFVDQHSISSLADDEARVDDREVPPIFRAAGEIARSSGMWWPYEHAAILSDRPAEIHVNERHLLHREDGPAVVYRDGWKIYAWNGKAVPERWIMQTESVPPGEYRGFDPSFGEWAKSRRIPARSTKTRAKSESISTALLPAEHGARLELLRAHANGQLPFHDRYVSGAHREVWTELIALGEAVREEPHAADGLAVAYETMHRVEANVRTLVERLGAMDYEFAARASAPSMWKRKPAARPHRPPTPNAGREVAEFQKQFGTLPLSLRAFYEVVGEVNLIGRHRSIDPRGNSVATDPLVVHGLDEGSLLYEDEDEDEGEGAATSIVIAPDDLHKANVSGGDPYTMEIPDLRADGEVMDERHRLFFVDYLRLCFAFGGFPGYEGRSTAPAELRTLSEGLIAF
jgi:hypothetical protein